MYSISAETVDNKYLKDNGDCKEEDNFYPWIAFTDEDGVIGHFIMRYIHGDNKVLRFGWVIVDDSIRGKGYGTSMLRTGLDYAFNILGVHTVTIGVFEHNDIAHTLTSVATIGAMKYGIRVYRKWNGNDNWFLGFLYEDVYWTVSGDIVWSSLVQRLKDIPEDKKVKYNNQEIDLLNNIRKQYDKIV